MSCPTCDHTMQNLGIQSGKVFYWCPRCGTLRIAVKPKVGENEDSVPKLVSRCREFMNVAVSISTPQTVADLHRLGVIESIYPPGRKT